MSGLFNTRKPATHANGQNPLRQDEDAGLEGGSHGDGEKSHAPAGYDPEPSRGDATKSQNTQLPLTPWELYNKKAESTDRDLIAYADGNADSLLIFAGLFSAVITAFLSQTFPLLQASPQSNTEQLLYLLLVQANQTAAEGNSPTPFRIEPYAIRVNCFLTAGLFTSLIVALLAILVKSWMRNYESNTSGVSSPHLKARIRQYRYGGVEKFHLAGVIGLMTTLLHLSLFITSVGFIDLLWFLNRTVGGTAIAIFGIGAILFLLATFIPLGWPEAPFGSPLLAFMTWVFSLWPQIRRRNRPSGEIGLDDPLDLSISQSLNRNKRIPAMIDLDVDILVSLIERSDKFTERWIIDRCFDKFPRLNTDEIIQKRPDIFIDEDFDVVLNVYRFLSKGCVNSKDPHNQTIWSARVDRAKSLREFLRWYLGLFDEEYIAEKEATEHREKLRELLPEDECKPMIRLLEVNTPLNSDKVSSCEAISKLEHLHMQGNRACSPWNEARTAILDPQVDTKRLARSIISLTHCCKYKSTAEAMGNDIQTRLPSLRERLQGLSAKDLPSFQGISFPLESGSPEWIRTLHAELTSAISRLP